MPNAIVVLNAGSSSIKFSLFFERGETLARRPGPSRGTLHGGAFCFEGARRHAESREILARRRRAGT